MANKNSKSSKPSAKAKSKPAAKPAAKAAAKSSKPAAKPAPKAAAKPAASAAKSSQKPAPKAAAKQAEKPTKVAAPKIEEAVEVEVAPPAVEVKKTNPVMTPAVVDAPPDEDVILTDAEGRRYCKVKDCDQYAVVEDHCRFHYLLLWKRIQVRRKILIDGKLERYVEELTARYPDKFLEMIRKDLRSEKDFLSAIAELEIDESAMDNDYEDENSNFIDEVRGMSSESSMSDEEEF